MSAYLVIVLLFLPNQQEPAQTVPAFWMTASSRAVCQEHANKAADEYRAKNADTVRRLSARVVGICAHKGELT